MNHSAAVLRNKGVCVEVNETVLVDGVWEVARDEEGNPRTGKAWVRFDGNALAEIEGAFTNLQGYRDTVAAQPFATVRRTLSIVFGWDDLHDPADVKGRLCSGCRRAGLSMREGGLDEYTTAIGAAIALANGLDPTKVVQMIEQGVRAIEEQRLQRDAALDEVLAQQNAPEPKDESTSTDGSDVGSVPVEVTMSSGG